jgi:Golgi phosphoprotein 3
MASSGLQRRRAGAGTGANGLTVGINGSYDEDDRVQSGASSPAHSALGSTSNGNAGTPSRVRNGTSGLTQSASAAEVRGGGGSITVTSERGHRIAYDPRDLQDEVETADHPRLTLMEECLLLGLKDKQVRMYPCTIDQNKYSLCDI